MQALLDVIVPVFMVIGFGYLAVWRNWFSDSGVDGLMKFTQNFAIPCLLFSAISELDVGASFDWRLIFSFYTGALSGFVLGLLGALYIFKRPLEDAVVIGFCGLFSNSVLLGLPLTERAYGADALEANFAIIALHSPFCYGVGIATMEVVRAKGQAGTAVVGRVLKAMFSNVLIVAIALGFALNLSGLSLSLVMQDGLDLMGRAALPAALFGLGGVLASYKPEGDMRLVLFICGVSLIIHPLITRGLGLAVSLSDEATRSAVLTAAMAPGVNAYIFASIYRRAMRVAATAVLLGTALTILTAWVWLGALP